MPEKRILTLFTIQVGKWRLARDLKIDMVDTTHGSRFQLFSPMKDAVYAYKNGTIDEEEYSRIYQNTLIESWQRNRQKWMDFLQAAGPSAMACYCGADQFCHRHLLIKFLLKLCKQLDIACEYYGEITDATEPVKEVTPHVQEMAKPVPPQEGDLSQHDGVRPERAVAGDQRAEPEQPAGTDPDPWAV